MTDYSSGSLPTLSVEPQTGVEGHVNSLVRWKWERVRARYALPPAPMSCRVGLVGAGVMGAQLAAAAGRAGLDLVATDTRPDALMTFPGRVAEAQCAAGSEEGSARLTRLRVTTDLAEVASCGVVIESVAEDVFAKQRLFAELEAHLPATALLGTNTSTISIARLATPLSRPDRLCGVHFFQPVVPSAIVELIPGPRTSPQVLNTAVSFAAALGKIPLVVPDGPGFLVNRLMMIYLSEAAQLVGDGAAMEDVERVAVEFGMARGPLALMDLIGLDVVLDCAWALMGQLGKSLVPSPAVVGMVKQGLLGRKSGQGFYCYEDAKRNELGAPRKFSPAACEIFARWGAVPRAHSDQAIAARLFLPMILEATRILAEGQIDDPRDVDLAVVFGFGFPAARGGLLCWADSMGPAAVRDMLLTLEQLGPRLRPTPLLEQMAASGESFYGR